MSKPKVTIDLSEYESLERVREMVSKNSSVTTYTTYPYGCWVIITESEAVEMLAKKVKRLEHERDNKKWWQF